MIKKCYGRTLCYSHFEPIKQGRAQKTRSFFALVLRQNSMRTENSAIPCHDGCLIQVIPFTFERQESVPVNPSGIRVYIRMEEPGRLRDAALVRIRQPDRTGDAALPVADEKGRDRRLRCEFFRLAFPSLV